MFGNVCVVNAGWWQTMSVHTRNKIWQYYKQTGVTTLLNHSVPPSHVFLRFNVDRCSCICARIRFTYVNNIGLSPIDQFTVHNLYAWFFIETNTIIRYIWLVWMWERANWFTSFHTSVFPSCWLLYNISTTYPANPKPPWRSSGKPPTCHHSLEVSEREVAGLSDV